MPGALKHSGMQEGVTRPVREFDKPETLLQIEPLHNGADGRARWLIETRLAWLVPNVLAGWWPERGAAS